MSFLSDCTSGGCGAKIGPGELAGFLQDLPKFHDERLLVGFDSADDAAVYQLTDDLAIISTTDFFSPMVEDPYTFGKIAATNALSDIYAMGGEPFLALNLVCFPEKMDKQMLSEILRGGAEKIAEAGAVLGGGHSIYDHEPKYGLAVNGRIDPRKIIHNNTPQEGDILILTKALGVGLIQAAVRVELASPEAAAAAVASMERLNKYASEKMRQFPNQVHACTDVTGFGLLAHALEMAGDDYTLVIDTAELPILTNAYDYAAEYLGTAAGQRNRNFLKEKVSVEGIAPAMTEILFDPQTSGGLLISVAPEAAADLLAEIQKDDPIARIIGEVVGRESNPLVIL